MKLYNEVKNVVQ